MKKSVLVMFHLMFWVLTVLLIQLVFQILEAGLALVGSAGTIKNTIVFNIVPLLIVLPIGALIFYTSYFSLNFFLKRPLRFTWILSGYILFALAVSLPGYIAAQAGHKVVNHLQGILSTLLFVAPILYFNVFGFLFRTFIEWLKDKEIKIELNKKNYEMELALMKAQINPHFLFNTINNIDVLIQKDAVKASEYLNKLSSILRFTLYETKTEKIALTTELSYIEKYIELQKIRTANSNYIKYEVKGEPNSLTIAPMLFIPFLENAFKHSENKKVENAINVLISIGKEKIVFDCENAYSLNVESDPEHKGLGNDLIQKRLALLYPDKNTLEIINKNGIYKVHLEIKL